MGTLSHWELYRVKISIALAIHSLDPTAIMYCSARWDAIGLERLTYLRYTAPHKIDRPGAGFYDS